jgi:hypothetical protein
VLKLLGLDLVDDVQVDPFLLLSEDEQRQGRDERQDGDGEFSQHTAEHIRPGKLRAALYLAKKEEKK